MESTRVVRTPRACSGYRHGGASVSLLYFFVLSTRFRRAQGWRHLRLPIILRPRLTGDTDENLFTGCSSATRMRCLMALSSSRQERALPCGGSSLGCVCRLPLRGRGRRRRVEAQAIRVCDDDVCVVDGLDCMHWKLPARLPSEVCASHCRFRCNI